MVRVRDDNEVVTMTNDMNDDSLINADDIRSMKLDFAMRAAGRYRDWIAETVATAIQHGHMQPQAAMSVLIEVAAIVAAAGLGPNGGAELLELMAHQCAEAMRRPRPTTN